MKYVQNSKNKSQEYAKFLTLTDKEALTTILFGQCDAATKTKIALGATYAADHNARRLSAFMDQMCTVCFGSDYGGPSYGPYNL